MKPVLIAGFQHETNTFDGARAMMRDVDIADSWPGFVRSAGQLDGIYLDLLGVMVTESYEDGEGELLRRVRDQVGANLPI